MVDMGTQTDGTDMNSQTDERKSVICLPQSVNTTCNLSELSFGGNIDLTFVPDCDDEDVEDVYEETTFTAEDNTVNEEKFIVYKSQLELLLEKCQSCGNMMNLTPKTVGTAVQYDLYCLVCEEQKVWSSQPYSGSMPRGNLELSAAVMFGGGCASQTLRILKFAGIQMMDVRTFRNIQCSYLTPAVMNVWDNTHSEMIEDIKESGSSLTLSGDARCDSPGHTAKYGSYTMMDMGSGKILDIQLVQSNEVKNSYAMELEGLKRSLTLLIQQHNLTITDLITDRHSSVKKYIREVHPSIKHWFDVWHVAKGVRKKMEAAGKKKGCEKVEAWSKSVSNHMYWCAATSNGDGALVQQKWLSILNHVTNVHEGHGELYPSCQHEKINDSDRAWVQKGFKPYYEIEKIVKGRLLKEDVKKLSPVGQTSSLESFHKVVCNFAPKSSHFFHAQMEARLYLAALHFNENCQRDQAVTKSGEPRFKVAYPKARKKEPVAMKVKVKTTYNYVQRLMDEVMYLRQSNSSYRKAKSANSFHRQRPLPLAQSTPVKRVPKEEVVARHKCRFATPNASSTSSSTTAS